MKSMSDGVRDAKEAGDAVIMFHLSSPLSLIQKSGFESKVPGAAPHMCSVLFFFLKLLIFTLPKKATAVVHPLESISHCE